MNENVTTENQCVIRCEKHDIEIMPRPIIGELLMTWSEAVRYGESFVNGWRLPDREELNSIFMENNSLSGEFEFEKSFYWSSEEFDSTHAWLQYFGDGSQYDTSKTYNNHVRYVRTIQ